LVTFLVVGVWHDTVLSLVRRDGGPEHPNPGFNFLYSFQTNTTPQTKLIHQAKKRRRPLINVQ
jgi:hypothetical protein